MTRPPPHGQEQQPPSPTADAPVCGASARSIRCRPARSRCGCPVILATAPPDGCLPMKEAGAGSSSGYKRPRRRCRRALIPPGFADRLIVPGAHDRGLDISSPSAPSVTGATLHGMVGREPRARSSGHSRGGHRRPTGRERARHWEIWRRQGGRRATMLISPVGLDCAAFWLLAGPPASWSSAWGVMAAPSTRKEGTVGRRSLL